MGPCFASIIFWFQGRLSGHAGELFYPGTKNLKGVTLWIKTNICRERGLKRRRVSDSGGWQLRRPAFWTFHDNAQATSPRPPRWWFAPATLDDLKKVADYTWTWVSSSRAYPISKKGGRCDRNLADMLPGRLPFSACVMVLLGMPFPSGVAVGLGPRHRPEPGHRLCLYVINALLISLGQRLRAVGGAWAATASSPWSVSGFMLTLEQ